MIYKVTTNTPLEQVKEEFEVHSKEQSFGILGTYEFKKMLEEKGFPIEKDITVYEICYPAAAQKILSEKPELAIFLPCRISLYEENGKTVISTLNMKTLIDSFNLSISLKAHVYSVYGKLEKIMKSWD